MPVSKTLTHRLIRRVAVATIIAAAVAVALPGGSTHPHRLKLISVHVPGTVGASTAWVNGAGAADATNDGTCATAGGQNQDLVLLGTGYHVPSGAVITGITVRVWGARTGGGSKPNDMTVTLVSSHWRASASAQRTAAYANNTNTAGQCPANGTAEVDNGGPTDLWGLDPTTQLTAANVNAPDFGVDVNSGSTQFLSSAVDLVNITVWYTALTPAAPTAVAPASSAPGFTPAWVTSATPSISGTVGVTGAADGTSVSVFVDGSASPYCTTTASVTTGAYACSGTTPLAQGNPHTAKVTQQDYDATSPSGLSPATPAFQIDSVAPSLSITSGPADGAAITTNSATFDFSASDATSGLATTTCSGDGAAFASCTSPQSLTSLTDGAHTFAVRVTDNAGNVSTVTRAYTVDTSLPVVSITSGPVNPTSSTAATFTFSATDPPKNGSASGIARLECRLDGATFVPCTSGGSGATFTGLSSASHTFNVRAVDQAGNTGTASSSSWKVDTAPPAISCAGAPTCVTSEGGNYGSRVTFRGTCPENGTTVRLFVDGAQQSATAVCSAGAWAIQSDALSTGSHISTARWVDGAGNVSAASPGWQFVAGVGPPS